MNLPHKDKVRRTILSYPKNANPSIDHRSQLSRLPKKRLIT
jgi:hypothetical protein